MLGLNIKEGRYNIYYYLELKELRDMDSWQGQPQSMQILYSEIYDNNKGSLLKDRLFHNDAVEILSFFAVRLWDPHLLRRKAYSEFT